MNIETCKAVAAVMAAWDAGSFRKEPKSVLEDEYGVELDSEAEQVALWEEPQLGRYLAFHRTEGNILDVICQDDAYVQIYLDSDEVKEL